MSRYISGAIHATGSLSSTLPAPNTVETALALPNTNEMGNLENCCSTQLIDGDGSFNVAGIGNFVKQVQLVKYGLSYVVVSIMGPQSSGKSALVNCLFGTNFKVMDASQGRNRTTNGIWIAKCNGIEPCTLVLDLEGTDGRERAAEDDITFEKQSALFALAVSDVVLINTWCHDIGRELASSKPLLKTVFQAMMKLFTPSKKTLLFVIRDKTSTPLKYLEAPLLEDIQKIWDAVPKPQDIRDAPLSDYFSVEVVALSNYEDKREKFNDEVASLRQRFCNSTAPGGLVGDRLGVDPASGFSLKSQKIWEIIKENKDLHLPSLQVMVAAILCERTANDVLVTLVAKEEWRQLEEEMKHSPTPEFVNKLNLLIDDCLSKYEVEASYFDEHTRSKYRDRLRENLLQLFKPAFISALEHRRSRALVEAKDLFNKALNGAEEFSLAAKSCIGSCMSHFDDACADVVIEQANWYKTEVREKLQSDIVAHVTSVRAAKISELTSSHQEKMKEALIGRVEALLNGANSDTWPLIRNHLRCETESAVSGFSAALTPFDMDEDTRKKMVLSLKKYARGVVEGKARKEAGRAPSHMKDKFTTVFSHGSDSMPRVWTGKEDIQDIAKTARSASMVLLSVMAAIRLNNDNSDNIEETLTVALMGSSSSVVKGGCIPMTKKKGKGRSSREYDLLASDTWEEVPPNRTLITPLHCKQLWGQFIEETDIIISNARQQQEVIAKIRGSGLSSLLTVLRICVSVAGIVTYVVIGPSL